MAFGLCQIYERYFLHEWPSGVPRRTVQARAWRKLGALVAAAVAVLALLLVLMARLLR